MLQLSEQSVTTRAMSEFHDKLPHVTQVTGDMVILISIFALILIQRVMLYAHQPNSLFIQKYHNPAYAEVQKLALHAI